MNRFRTGALPLGAVTSRCLALSACTASTSSNSSAQATPVAETSAPPIPAGLESFYGQKIDWSACEDDASFQCATAQVPLDYANPTGQTIDIALKKLPSTSGEPIGTLFVNPGGPGGSGVEHVSAGEAAFSADLRSNFDIIGFDPRGVGASAPLTCLSPEEIDQAAKAATGQAAPSADDSASKAEQGGVRRGLNPGRPGDGRQVRAELVGSRHYRPHGHRLGRPGSRYPARDVRGPPPVLHGGLLRHLPRGSLR